MILHGDCLEHLRSLEDNSVDALVTDPPAGISFMGKDWDGDKGGRAEWIAWMASVMKECMRVMKPGAHGLVWALPRTSHWTAMALEDAGFEIRDCIYHCFGSGFPKSLDVSKAIDKAAGIQREILGHTKNARPNRVGKPTKLSGLMIIGGEITAPSTDDAKRWQGFGTALKPAVENWWLVRKPCSEKTVAKNVLKWGTGAINVDAGRIGTEQRVNQPAGSYLHTQGINDGRSKEVIDSYIEKQKTQPSTAAQGRFPSHLLFSHEDGCSEDGCVESCAVRELDRQSGDRPGFKTGGKNGAGYRTKYVNGDSKDKTLPAQTYGDSGGASRFFYCAKVSTSERNAGLNGMPKTKMEIGDDRPSGNSWERRGRTSAIPRENTHPTVKPQKLMRYLIKLITPPNGCVLDCFAGSGSTLLAAKTDGFSFIGIEQNAEYVEIAKRRVG